MSLSYAKLLKQCWGSKSILINWDIPVGDNPRVYHAHSPGKLAGRQISEQQARQNVSPAVV